MAGRIWTQAAAWVCRAAWARRVAFALVSTVVRRMEIFMGVKGLRDPGVQVCLGFEARIVRERE
jgi:hypothetical protein